MQVVRQLLEFERLKGEYEELERRGIPMSVREWYERKLAEMRAELRSCRRRRPLGEVLVEMGVIDREQLGRAIFMQRSGEGAGLLLGELLLKMGSISKEHLQNALMLQEREKDNSPSSSSQTPDKESLVS